MNRQRLLELDALRGLAALSVVFYHYFFRYDQLYGHAGLSVDWTYYGKFGVQLFFMVSGFVIFWTLNKIERPLDFVASRFSRLYPAYWAAVLFTFSFVYIFGLSGREVSPGHAMSNLLMFHEIFGIPHVDGVYWTLTVELIFYFWIFLIYLTSNLERVEEIFSVVILASVLHSMGVILIPSVLFRALIMDALPLFMAGICFYKLANGYDGAIKTMCALFFSLLSTVAIYSFDHFILFSGFYLVFYMAISGRIKVLALKPLVFLGSISYSLYLLHQNIGYVIINVSYELGFHPLLGICFSLLIVIILSTIFMKYVENPSLRYIRRTYKNNKNIQRLARKMTFHGIRS